MKTWLTWVVFAVTTVTTALGYAVPAVVDALARDPGFFDGEVWRLVTPILVNPQGWGQIFNNGIGLLIFGALVEQVYGRARWLVLYLTGGVVGEVYSYASEYYNAGSSVAVAGLLGGVAAWLLVGRPGTPSAMRAGAGALLVGAFALAVSGDNHGAPLLAGAVVGGVMIRFPHGSDRGGDARAGTGVA
ncbi:rhomboid family intramembrane serine protease [Cryptosporangium aurantiacum]|uniref:Rhomboid family protein n=1 Tax=Cryptosporangium aurantiacum TaxID=134849 RepID=A0A1M7M855_9ACTN|nr:rhomboid family intramembrane serine protease [Cryptosporangium aurantiacum]SHM86862.1 Rhomboid family protein [Cryptosporangium aurantiacum]